MNDQTTVEPSTKLAKIEDKLDRSTLSEVAISGVGGSVKFRTMTEIMEFSKLMSLAGVAVPPHLRGNPGACLAICIQATEWEMSPFQVANKSYVVANYSKDGPIERLSYESQLLHAVIEARAPLVGRLRVEYEGEGDDRVCIVSGTFKGETEPHILKSPPLGKRKPGLNEKGYSKGSPLWYSKPDLQQFYDTSRDWARMWCPDVLMGLYTPDEIEEYAVQPIEPKDVSPNLMERLPGKIEGAGFAEAVVDQGLAQQVESTKTKTKQKGKGKAATEPKTETEPVQAENAGETATKVLEPKTAAEYLVYCEAWINGITAQTAEMAESRYHSEQDLRDACGVPIKERKRLNDLVVDKIEAFQTEAIDGAKPA